MLSICIKAIHVGSANADPAKWRVTQEMMEKEISKLRKAKAEHTGEKGKKRRMIGFQPV